MGEGARARSPEVGLSAILFDVLALAALAALAAILQRLWGSIPAVTGASLGALGLALLYPSAAAAGPLLFAGVAGSAVVSLWGLCSFFGPKGLILLLAPIAWFSHFGFNHRFFKLRALR